MSAGMSAKKLAPVDVVAQTIEGIQSDAHEALTDKLTERVRAALSGPAAAMYPQLAPR